MKNNEEEGSRKEEQKNVWRKNRRGVKKGEEEGR
jgi:hypothetical protein